MTAPELPAATPITPAPYAPAHLDAVVRLCAAEGWPTWSDPDTVARATSAPGAVSLVALTPDGEVAAFSHTVTDHAATAYLSILVTAPAHRRRGVGRLLVDATLARCANGRLDLLTLEDSAAFYASFPHRTLQGFRLFRAP